MFRGAGGCRNEGQCQWWVGVVDWWAVGGSCRSGQSSRSSICLFAARQMNNSPWPFEPVALLFLFNQLERAHQKELDKLHEELTNIKHSLHVSKGW